MVKNLKTVSLMLLLMGAPFAAPMQLAQALQT